MCFATLLKFILLFFLDTTVLEIMITCMFQEIRSENLTDAGVPKAVQEEMNRYGSPQSFS